jgi:proprotein convertase subtilisin/kexin type 5
MKCTKCPEGQVLDAASGKCSSGCPAKQYYDENEQTCKACGSNCLKCSSAGECDLCQEGASKNIGTADCFISCPVGTYTLSTNIDSQCLPCHSTCSQCSGPLESDCTVCPEATYLFDPTFISRLQDGDKTLKQLIDTEPPKGDCRFCGQGFGP